MNLLSRGKEPLHVTHRDSRTFRVITIGSFVLTWGVASIRSLLRIRSLLPIFLHNARKKAPHDRRHGRGLKRPIPDEHDKQIPHEARGNAQLVPNLSLDSSWQGIKPQARQQDDSPIGLGPTAEFRTSWNHCRGCIMDNRAMTPNETVSFHQCSTPWIPNYLASRPLHYLI